MVDAKLLRYRGRDDIPFVVSDPNQTPILVFGVHLGDSGIKPLGPFRQQKYAWFHFPFAGEAKGVGVRLR